MEHLELIKKTLEPDIPYWLAQELCRELQISYEDFIEAIQLWISACESNGYNCSNHFKENEEDYELSQYACYLTIERISFENREYHKKLKNYFYTKDFLWWNIEKQKVHEWWYLPKNGSKRFTNEREIWNTKRWINIGNETDWKWKYLRPVLILKNIWSLCLVAPLTTKGPAIDHPASHLYHKITSINFENCESFVMLSQIKMIDKKRCIKNMKTMDQEEFKCIKNLLRDMYFPED